MHTSDDELYLLYRLILKSTLWMLSMDVRSLLHMQEPISVAHATVPR